MVLRKPVLSNPGDKLFVECSGAREKISQSHWLKEDFSGVECLESRNSHEDLSFHYTLLHSGMRGCAAQHRLPRRHCSWGLLRSGAPTYAACGMDVAWGLTDAGRVTRGSWECLCLQPATLLQQMLRALKVRSPFHCCPQRLYCPSGRQSECLGGIKNFLHPILTHCVFPTTFDNGTLLKHGNLLSSTWRSRNELSF